MSGTTCPVPTIWGRGLTDAEWQRVDRARHEARVRHGVDLPCSPLGEWERVGAEAARAELRRVLAERQTAVLV